MKNFTLCAIMVIFAGACASKTKSADTTPAAPTPANSQATTAASGSDSSSNSVTCTRKTDQRTLEVKAKGPGCEVIYTKHGNAKSIASSEHGSKHCMHVSKRIQKHLTNAGFSCQ